MSMIVSVENHFHLVAIRPDQKALTNDPTMICDFPPDIVLIPPPDTFAVMIFIFKYVYRQVMRWSHWHCCQHDDDDDDRGRQRKSVYTSLPIPRCRHLWIELFSRRKKKEGRTSSHFWNGCLGEDEKPYHIDFQLQHHRSKWYDGKMNGLERAQANSQEPRRFNVKYVRIRCFFIID